MNTKNDLQYFIPDLFKFSEETKRAFVKQDDPYISKKKLVACTGFYKRDEVKEGDFNILEYLGKDMFEEAWQKHDEKEKKLLEEDKIKEEVKAKRLQVETAVKKQLDKEVENIIKSHTKCVKRSCPVKIPYKSCLNKAEHELYVKAFLKYQTRKPKNSLEEQEYQCYLSLQNRVFDEQKHLMDVAKSVADMQLSDYNELPHTIQDYISRYSEHNYQQVLNYPRLYTLEQLVPLVPPKSQMYEGIVFEHMGHLLSLGIIPHLKMPYSTGRTVPSLANDDAFVQKNPPDRVWQPPQHLRNKTKEGTYLSKNTVSDDPNCVFLAQKHQANIVISPSVLKTLLDNPGPSFDKEWDIPVVVKSYPSTETDGSTHHHRVVFINKPIKKKLWNSQEEKSLFYKKSALICLTEFKTSKMFKMKSPALFSNLQKNSIKQEYRNDSTKMSESSTNRSLCSYDDVFDISDVEVDTFGTDCSSAGAKRKLDGESNEPTGRQKPMKKTRNDTTVVEELISPKKEECVKEEEVDIKEEPVGDSVLDSLIENQTKLLQSSDKTSSRVMTKARRVGEQSTMNDVGKEATRSPWSNRLSTNWTDHPDPQIPVPFSSTNLHYQLFKLHSTSSVPSSKPLPAINVLVRHHIHGVSQENKNIKGKTFKSGSYVVVPKIENQVYFGCEVNTRREIVHQYSELLVRPNAYVLQVRVCSQSGQIVLSEEKDLQEVIREGHQSHIQFQPQQSLTLLHSTFNSLMGLVPGHYLLHHPNKQEAFVQLMRHIDDSDSHLGQSLFDLHSSYGFQKDVPEKQAVITRRSYSASPWLPIDTNVLTPFHLKHLKIPGTFPMGRPEEKRLSKNERKKINAKSKNKKMFHQNANQSQQRKS